MILLEMSNKSISYILFLFYNIDIFSCLCNGLIKNIEGYCHQSTVEKSSTRREYSVDKNRLRSDARKFSSNNFLMSQSRNIYIDDCRHQSNSASFSDTCPCRYRIQQIQEKKKTKMEKVEESIYIYRLLFIVITFCLFVGLLNDVVKFVFSSLIFW